MIRCAKTSEMPVRLPVPLMRRVHVGMSTHTPQVGTGESCLNAGQNPPRRWARHP